MVLLTLCVKLFHLLLQKSLSLLFEPLVIDFLVLELHDFVDGSALFCATGASRLGHTQALAVVLLDFLEVFANLFELLLEQGPNLVLLLVFQRFKSLFPVFGGAPFCVKAGEDFKLLLTDVSTLN